MRRALRFAVTLAAVVDAALLFAIAAGCVARDALSKPVQSPTRVVRRVPSEWN